MLAPLLVAVLSLAAPEVRLERWPDGTPRAEYEVRVEADGREVRHGPWRSWHENGKDFEQGAFADGLRSGKWSVRWPNGKRREQGAYAAGRREGPWKHYHEQGPKAAEGSYSDGLRAGAWTFWNADRSIDEDSTGTYVPVTRTYGAQGVTGRGSHIDWRPRGLWVWRRADGSLRLAGHYGVDGPEGPWVSVFADGSLDLDGQCGTYAAGERVGPLAGWPEGVEPLPLEPAPDPRRASALAVDAAAAEALEAWLGAEQGAREAPLRQIASEPRAGFVACVAFLQGVDYEHLDERARRVAQQALPQLIGVAFPLDEGEGAAARNARRALEWRDHVEVQELDRRDWRVLFSPRWRMGPIALRHTPLVTRAGPLEWAASELRTPTHVELLAERGPAHPLFILSRERIAEARGGTGTRPAVLAGLGWLTRAQAAEGCWERGTPRDLEATAWALQAYASEVEDVVDGREWQEPTERALRWLLSTQRPEHGRYASLLGYELRSHALALWALAELAHEHSLPSLDTSMERATEALLAEQLASGAFPRDAGAAQPDVLATLYAAHALRAVGSTGLADLREPYLRALEWLEASTARDGSLVEPDGRTPAATAASAMLRLLSGYDPDRDALIGRQVGWMIAHPSSIEPRHPQLDAEYLMFGAWTCLRVGGDVWTSWNKNMKVQLLQVQKREGALAGSWETLGVGVADVTSVTAQRVLTFQSYYRYAGRTP